MASRTSKITAIVISVTVALSGASLVACQSQSNSSSPVTEEQLSKMRQPFEGKWLVADIQSIDIAEDDAALSELKGNMSNMYVDINQDGTATLAFTGDVQQGLWDVTETGERVMMSFESLTAACYQENDNLIVELSNGINLICQSQ